MRFVVVVIAWAAACTKPVPQPLDCATYTRCFLDNDGGGYRRIVDLIQALPEDDDDPDDPEDHELDCYAGFVVAAEQNDLDTIIEPMQRAYGAEGTCWAGGYAAVAGQPDLETRYAVACEEHCQKELAADCARSPGNRVCVGDAAVQAFCAANPALVEDAKCPVAGAGE